ncbi:hypothetical protein EJB05_42106, partial [Eragrostis curvula]
MTRHQTTSLLRVELFQAAVVFITGIPIAAVTAVCFWESHDYVILFIGGALTVFTFFAICCRLYSVARRADDDGEEEETLQQRIASQGPPLVGNQQRDNVQIPAITVAIAQLDRQSPPPAKADGVDECVICLGSVGDDGLETRQLQTCRHVFHRHCVEQWLRAHPTCPICRCNARQESLEVVLRLNA